MRLIYEASQCFRASPRLLTYRSIPGRVQSLGLSLPGVVTNPLLPCPERDAPQEVVSRHTGDSDAE